MSLETKKRFQFQAQDSFSRKLRLDRGQFYKPSQIRELWSLGRFSKHFSHVNINKTSCGICVGHYLLFCPRGYKLKYLPAGCKADMGWFPTTRGGGKQGTRSVRWVLTVSPRFFKEGWTLRPLAENTKCINLGASNSLRIDLAKKIGIRDVITLAIYVHCEVIMSPLVQTWFVFLLYWVN